MPVCIDCSVLACWKEKDGFYAISSTISTEPFKCHRTKRRVTREEVNRAVIKANTDATKKVIDRLLNTVVKRESLRFNELATQLKIAYINAQNSLTKEIQSYHYKKGVRNMKAKDRFEFGKDIVKVLKKHFKLDGVTVTNCKIACDAENTTQILLALEF